MDVERASHRLWWRGVGWVGKEGEGPKWPLNLTLTRGMGIGGGEKCRVPSPSVLMWILDLVPCDDSKIWRMKSSRAAIIPTGW